MGEGISIPMGNVAEQLGVTLKKACLQCHVEKAKRPAGRLHGFNCYACGTCYNDITGESDPSITKHLIFREFQERGLRCGPKDVDNIYLYCTSTRNLSFGGALNIILVESAKKQGKPIPGTD